MKNIKINFFLILLMFFIRLFGKTRTPSFLTVRFCSVFDVSGWVRSEVLDILDKVLDISELIALCP